MLPAKSVPVQVKAVTSWAWLTTLLICCIVPIDIFSTLQSKDPEAIGILWDICYWSTQLLTWLLIPLYMGYADAGEFTWNGRMIASARSNGLFMILMVLPPQSSSRMGCPQAPPSPLDPQYYSQESVTDLFSADQCPFSQPTRSVFAMRLPTCRQWLAAWGFFGQFRQVTSVWRLYQVWEFSSTIHLVLPVSLCSSDMA